MFKVSGEPVELQYGPLLVLNGVTTLMNGPVNG